MSLDPPPRPTRDRLFAWDEAVPLRRRPADVLRLVVAGVGFALLGWAASTDPPIDQRVAELFADLPDWLRFLAWIGYSGSSLVALGLVVAAVAAGSRSRGIVRDLLGTLAVGMVAGSVAIWLASDTWPSLLPELVDPPTTPGYPSLRAGLTVAVLSTAGPYLTDPVRRACRRLMVVVLVSPVLLGFATVTGSLGAAGLAVMSVAAVRAAIGSPEGLPSLSKLAVALRTLGVDAEDLRYLPDQPGTVGLAEAGAPDGRRLTIKVYGRDSADRARSLRLWRSLWYRSSGSAPGSSPLQQVEHEALITIVAGRAGVTAPTVLAAGQDVDDDVVLVVADPAGVPLADPDAPAPDDATLTRLWQGLLRLHEGRITHGDLSPESIRIGADGPAFVDFHNGSMVPTSEHYGADVAAMLGTTAAFAGIDRAVAAATAAFDHDRLEAALPLLQDGVVPPELRRRMKRADVGFDDLRAALATALGIESPPVQDLRRVKLSNIVMVVFAAIAANAIISQVAEIGWDTLREDLAAASVGWLIATLVIRFSSFTIPVIGLRAVVPQPVPFAPTALLQSARTFVGLVVPSTLGRVALDVRYLQRLGVPATTALTQGPVISLIGFAVEVVLLLSTSWALGQTIDRSTTDKGGPSALLVIVAVLVVLGVIAVFAVPKLRAAVVPKVRAALADLRAVVTSPARLGRVAFSELLERIVSALALATTAAAFGASVPFTALVFVCVGSGLLAGIAPVPGGVGVAEATMTALLTAVGVPPEQAFAIAITHRVLTSYLPPLPGFFSLRWLRANGYL